MKLPTQVIKRSAKEQIRIMQKGTNAEARVWTKNRNSWRPTERYVLVPIDKAIAVHDECLSVAKRVDLLRKQVRRLERTKANAVPLDLFRECEILKKRAKELENEVQAQWLLMRKQLIDAVQQLMIL